MNISQTIINSVKASIGCCGAATLALGAMTGAAQATTLPGAVSTPVGSGIQSVGGAISAVAQGHAGVAPTVYNTSPTLEPFADGVTSGLQALGNGVTYSGQVTQSGGLKVTPVAGAATAVQTLRQGNLIKAQVGSVAIGQGAPTTVIGVGALTSAPPQGVLATAGVANANALLTANAAPQ